MSQIIGVRRVKDSKDGAKQFQGEITDVVILNPRINVLQHLNKGDERFNPAPTPRHAWFAVTLASLEDLGADQEALKAIDALEMNERFPLDIQDPTIAGEKLTIQVNESTEPDEYQKVNFMDSAKQLPITERVAKNKTLAGANDLTPYIGETGYFLDKEGKHIFSRTIVSVASQVRHTIVPVGAFVPKSALDSFGAELAKPRAIASKQVA